MSASMGRTSIIASSVSEGKDLLPFISGKVRWWAFPDFSLHPAEWRGTSCLRIVSAAGSDKRGICDNTTGRTSVRTHRQRLLAWLLSRLHGTGATAITTARKRHGTEATAVLADHYQPSWIAFRSSRPISIRTHVPSPSPPSANRMAFLHAKRHAERHA